MLYVLSVNNMPKLNFFSFQISTKLYQFDKNNFCLFTNQKAHAYHKRTT